MNLRQWFRNHSLKLLAIRDTPEAIAGGVAIGMFFGLTPLFGFKTLLSLLCAWLTRCNLLAAVIAVTCHDLVLPFMPFLYRLEYDVGYWLLSQPHHLPVALRRYRWSAETFWNWRTFITIGKPLLIGSVVCSVPVAAATYLATWKFLVAYRRRHSKLPKDAGHRAEGKD